MEGLPSLDIQDIVKTLKQLGAKQIQSDIKDAAPSSESAALADSEGLPAATGLLEARAADPEVADPVAQVIGHATEMGPGMFKQGMEAMTGGKSQTY